MKKKIFFYLLAILLIAISSHYLPPLPVSAPDTPSIDKLSTYLNNTESQFGDIIKNSEKTIVWADQENTKTEFAVVYLHGFSASRQESAPLSDLLAQSIGANAFHTRLNGHGRGNAAMAENTLKHWKKDALEAYQIGSTIGNKVIIVSVSTGGTLSTWLDSQENTDNIVAQLMISPNFDVPAQNAYLLDLPLGVGVLIARLTSGKNHSWTPKNALQEKYWSTNYPIKGVRPMVQLLKAVKKIDKSTVTTPTLMLYSPKDTVVLTSAIKENFEQFGSQQKQIVSFNATEDTHVLASEIVSPNSVKAVLDILLNFLYSNEIVKQPINLQPSSNIKESISNTETP